MNDLYIMHYGVGHDKGGHSGRYPWGSGENPYGGGTKIPTKRDVKNFVKGISSIKRKNMDTRNLPELNYANVLATTDYVKNNPEGARLPKDTEWTDENINKAIKYLWYEVGGFSDLCERYYKAQKNYAEDARNFIKKYANIYDLNELYDSDLYGDYARSMIDDLWGRTVARNDETAYDMFVNDAKQIFDGRLKIE